MKTDRRRLRCSGIRQIPSEILQTTNHSILSIRRRTSLAVRVMIIRSRGCVRIHLLKSVVIVTVDLLLVNRHVGSQVIEMMHCLQQYYNWDLDVFISSGCWWFGLALCNLSTSSDLDNVSGLPVQFYWIPYLIVVQSTLVVSVRSISLSAAHMHAP